MPAAGARLLPAPFRHALWFLLMTRTLYSSLAWDSCLRARSVLRRCPARRGGGEPAQQRLCPGGGAGDTRGHRDTRGGRAGRFGSGSREVPHAKGDTAKSLLVTTVLLAGRCRVEQERPTGRAG